MIVGIDASRNRSGGAKAHIIGILSSLDPESHGIHKVHLWAYDSLLQSIPNRKWLVKHNPPSLNRSLFAQILWQTSWLSLTARKLEVDILLTTDASSFCRFKPMVSISQDLSCYEPGILKEYKFGVEKIRLWLIFWLQNKIFLHSDGVIFLNKYCGDAVQKVTGSLKRIAYIPHGIDDRFRTAPQIGSTFAKSDVVISCIYISPIFKYKNQVEVVKAFEKLRDDGFQVSLSLIGGVGSRSAQRTLTDQIGISDPDGEFIQWLGDVPHDEIQNYVSAAHIFIFASSCEALPVTLLEGMAAGKAIACSEHGVMPSILRDAGVYFNPSDPSSIAGAIQKLIIDQRLRAKITTRAILLSEKYSWSRCAAETFSFVAKIRQQVKRTI
jgi:glycosyltransferase involved in cell wall biosynthesis